jgi:hypothetical protein
VSAKKKTKSKSSRKKVKRVTSAKSSKARKAAPARKAKAAKRGKVAKRGNAAKRTKVAKRAKAAKRVKAEEPAAPAPRALPRATASASVVLEGVVAEAPVGRVEVLQEKLNALKRMEEALRAQRTGTAADDDVINPNLLSLRNAKRRVEAQIVAAQAQDLDPPSEADVTALHIAIRDAETAIAQNAMVNRLVQATSALINALNA